MKQNYTCSTCLFLVLQSTEHGANSPDKPIINLGELDSGELISGPNNRLKLQRKTTSVQKYE